MLQKTQWVSLLAVALCVISPVAAQETDTYYTNLSEERLSCAVARSLKASLAKENKTWAEKKKEIIKRLRSFSDFEKAYAPDGQNIQGYANGVLISRSGYLVQDAFMDPSLLARLPKENWLGSYNFMAAVARSRFWDLKEPYDFVNDSNVIQKMEIYVKSPEKFSIPEFEVPYSLEEKKKLGLEDRVTPVAPGYTTISTAKKIVRIFPDTPEEILKKAYVHFNEVNTLASPFFLWLAQQPKESVDHIEAFNKAVEIYGDPLTALGVIAWIPGNECMLGDRRKVALASSRMKPVLFRVSDHAGTIYHFWGYLVRGILGEPDGISMLRFRSRVFEGVIQKDGQDVTADLFGLRVAEKIVKSLEGDDSVCAGLEVSKQFPAISETARKVVPINMDPNHTGHQDSSSAVPVK